MRKFFLKGREERGQLDRLPCMRFAANAVQPQLQALPYNLTNFLRTLAPPAEVEHWSRPTLRIRLVKIGAKIVRHSRSIASPMAEVTLRLER